MIIEKSSIIMFRYPGGKSKVKEIIFSALKEKQDLHYEHSFKIEYREPFIGGGGLTKYCLKNKFSSLFWINDLDPGIASIWHCVINDTQSLINIVNNYYPNVNDFWEFKKDLTSENINKFSQLEIAFRKLVIHQFSFSGLGLKAGSPIGGKSQTQEFGERKKYSFDCRWSPKNIIKEINQFKQTSQNVKFRQNTCTNLDYKTLILDNQHPAILYLDPPYYDKGESLYHYFFTEENHIEMSEMLKDTPHSWVLSYDNHPRILELYNWATIAPLNINYSINGVNQTKEILITNPLYVR